MDRLAEAALDVVGAITRLWDYCIICLEGYGSDDRCENPACSVYRLWNEIEKAT